MVLITCLVISLEFQSLSLLLVIFVEVNYVERVEFDSVVGVNKRYEKLYFTVSW